jgi:hypothetical protein
LSVEDVHLESDHTPHHKLGYLILYKVTKSVRVREKLVLLAQAGAVLPCQQSPSVNGVEKFDLKLEVIFERSYYLDGPQKFVVDFSRANQSKQVIVELNYVAFRLLAWQLFANSRRIRYQFLMIDLDVVDQIHRGSFPGARCELGDGTIQVSVFATLLVLSDLLPFADVSAAILLVLAWVVEQVGHFIKIHVSHGVGDPRTRVTWRRVLWFAVGTHGGWIFDAMVNRRYDQLGTRRTLQQRQHFMIGLFLVVGTDLVTELDPAHNERGNLGTTCYRFKRELGGIHLFVTCCFEVDRCAFVPICNS